MIKGLRALTLLFPLQTRPPLSLSLSVFLSFSLSTKSLSLFSPSLSLSSSFALLFFPLLSDLVSLWLGLTRQWLLVGKDVHMLCVCVCVMCSHTPSDWDLLCCRNKETNHCVVNGGVRGSKTLEQKEE